VKAALAARVQQEGLRAFLSNPTKEEIAQYKPENLIKNVDSTLNKRVGGLCKYTGFPHWWSGGRVCYNAMADYMLYGYYLTGDRRMWDCAMQHGNALLEESNDIFPGRSGAGRGSTAIDLYQATGDERYLDFARRQVKYSLETKSNKPDQPDTYAIENFFYGPMGERWYEMTQDPELAGRWPLWADCVLNNRGSLGDYRRDVHYEKLAYGYILSGRKEFLEYGLEMLKFFVEDRRLGKPGEWDGNGAMQAVAGYTIQQWGVFLYALQEYQRKTGQWLPLPARPDSDRIGMLLRYYKGVPLTMYMRKEPGESIDLCLPGSMTKDYALTITGPDGRVIWDKALDVELTEDKPPVAKGWLKVGPNDPAGDYRIDLYAPRALTPLWGPQRGTYRKMVVSMPFELNRRARFYFLPVKAQGRPSSFTFRINGGSSTQCYRLEGPDGQPQAYAENDGGPLWLTHRPDPASIGGEPWFFWPGAAGAGFTTAQGDIFPYVSFKREQFFIPKGLENAAGTDVELLWPFNEGEGQTILDAGSGEHGGHLGASLEPDDADPQWIPDGVSGSALRFSGKAYVRSSPISKTAYRFGNLSEFTAEAWVRIPPTSKTPTAMISVAESFGLSAGADGLAVIAQSVDPATAGPNAPVSFPVSVSLADGNWHHVALSYDGKMLRVFADGKCVARNDRVNGYLNPSRGPFLAGAPAIGGIGFVGDIDEVKVSHWCRYRDDFSSQRP
jgi:hypothetical protein